ncbi:phage tail protein [Actinoplanes sp. NPDC049548]|uniref:phage tail protein n=1 Tax=Actinoplanes sp. NPDC049548 TaxID=3155152 RepID=UPI00342C40D6
MSLRAALVIAAGEPAPRWDEMTGTVLPDAFRRCGLDWPATERSRSAADLLIIAHPAAVTGLSRRFARELAALLPDRVRLGLGLDVGLCHRDDSGWYGDAVTSARRIAVPPGADDPFTVRLALTDGAHHLAPSADLTLEADHRSGQALWVQTVAADASPSEQTLSVAAETAARTSPGAPVRLVAEAVDAVAAPVASFAERLPMLLSPDVAPSDVLAWMYQVLGVDSPRLLDDRNGRRLVSGLVRCYRKRGTARGLADLIELRYGVAAEIVDPGTATWSARPETPVRQPPQPVTVLLDTDEPLNGLDEVIRSALPAGVGYRVSRRAATPA